MEGEGFTNTVTQYDELSPGRLVDVADLPPFSLELLDLDDDIRRPRVRGAGPPRTSSPTFATAPHRGSPSTSGTFA